jgi:hypothetical protein
VLEREGSDPVTAPVPSGKFPVVILRLPFSRGFVETLVWRRRLNGQSKPVLLPEPTDVMEEIHYLLWVRGVKRCHSEQVQFVQKGLPFLVNYE